MIAWRCGSVPEVIDHGVSGFTVDTLEAAVDAVERIDTLDRARVRATFEARFSVSRMASDYVALYRQLGNRKRWVRPPARRHTAAAPLVPLTALRNRLARERDTADVVARELAFRHRVFDGLALADEVEHHHRMREQRDQRREDPERDVSGDRRGVACAQAQNRAENQTEKTGANCCEKRLSQGLPPIKTSAVKVCRPRRS